MRKLQRTQPGRDLAQLSPARAAGAFTAASVGAMAVGALAIGSLLLRKVAVRSAYVSRRSIDDLNLNRLRVYEFVRDDVPPPPIR